MDARRLKDSFSQIAMYGDEVALFFYSDLFIKYPEIRDLFPISMRAQRDHLIAALAQIVSHVDRADELTDFLDGLGRDHRKFGAVAEHYDAVCDCLLTTIAHFSGENWTGELAADWTEAFHTIAGVMIAAAKRDESVNPACWQGTIIGTEHRSFDITVLQVKPEPTMSYLPGQSVAIETPRRPRLWRYYSIANAPREDGTLEFHVRLIDGGAVSMALAAGQAVGDDLRLGPPVGALTLDTESGRDILLIAASTGLAPLKALLEQVATLSKPPSVHVFFGARTADGLYDLPSLEKMAAGHDWLTVTASVSSERRFKGGETGSLPDVVSRHGSWSQHDVYLAGPTEMVHETTARLTSAGTPRNQIHVEDFGWSEP